MSLSEEDIQALGDAIAAWRMQEYIYISFFAFYVYYMLTTIDEEASVVHPQKWGGGKSLFMVARYGTCACVALQLTRDYRNYYEISPKSCKAMSIIYQAAHNAAVIACDISLGLCISALLQVGLLSLIALLILCVVPSVVICIFALVSEFQFPAESISALDRELGYPCYVVSYETLMEATIAGLGRDARSYTYFATTALLLILAITTLMVRYRGQNGRLVRVIRRDGGLYYVALAVLRFGQAVVNTPNILPPSQMGDSPAVMLVNASNWVIIPILAQRLLINIRKVDYIGSQPVASELLFATLPRDAKGQDGAVDSFEMDAGSSTLRRHSESEKPNGRQTPDIVQIAA